MTSLELANIDELWDCIALENRSCSETTAVRCIPGLDSVKGQQVKLLVLKLVTSLVALENADINMNNL